jgi:hypothetical protein
MTVVGKADERRRRERALAERHNAFDDASW